MELIFNRGETGEMSLEQLGVINDDQVTRLARMVDDPLDESSAGAA